MYPKSLWKMDPNCRKPCCFLDSHGFWNQVLPMLWNVQVPISAKIIKDFTNPPEHQTIWFIWHFHEWGHRTRKILRKRCAAPRTRGHLHVHVDQLPAKAHWVFPRRKDWNNSKNCKAFGIQIPFKISFEIQIPIGLDDLKTRYIYPLSSDKVLSFPKILGAFEARFPFLICILLTSFDLQLVVRLIQFPLRPGPSVQITDRIGVSPGIMGLRREATVGLHVPLGTCYLGMGSSRKANWIGNSCFDNFVFNPKIRLLALNDFYMHNLFPLHTSHQSRLVTLVLPCAMNMFAIMVGVLRLLQHPSPSQGRSQHDKQTCPEFHACTRMRRDWNCFDLENSTKSKNKSLEWTMQRITFISQPFIGGDLLGYTW